MKTATVTQIKKELLTKPPKELVELTLRLSKFKKENKELLTYLLYEADDENGFIKSVKVEMDQAFAEINTTSFFFIKKSVRKILRATKKYIRYSQKKTTQAELLIYFCQKLRDFSPSISYNTVLINLFEKQVELIEKTVEKLDEDFQLDYRSDIEELKG
ncbi:MAG: hypothetical protein ACI81S_001571 [Sphingobacteriales bacterium]|jgi:hypothetical protein